MRIEEFQKKIEKILKKPVCIRINENHTTLLNYIPKRKGPDFYSVHRIFLEADPTVEDALIQHMQGRKNKFIKQTLNKFIHHHLKTVDYSDKIEEKALQTEGRVFHLKKLYNSVTALHFQNSLDLNITWFGHSRRSRRRIPSVIGQYNDLLKLIKIHRWLDHSSCPDYFISFVIYHEILHALYPPYLDKGNRYRYHDRVFREKERQFSYYHQAKAWEKTHQWQLC